MVITEASFVIVQSKVSETCEIRGLPNSIRSILNPGASDKLDQVGRSSNGKTAASGAAYRGSNPCLPAKTNKINNLEDRKGGLDI